MLLLSLLLCLPHFFFLTSSNSWLHPLLWVQPISTKVNDLYSWSPGLAALLAPANSMWSSIAPGRSCCSILILSEVWISCMTVHIAFNCVPLFYLLVEQGCCRDWLHSELADVEMYDMSVSGPQSEVSQIWPKEIWCGPDLTSSKMWMTSLKAYHHFILILIILSGLHIFIFIALILNVPPSTPVQPSVFVCDLTASPTDYSNSLFFGPPHKSLHDLVHHLDFSHMHPH